MPKDTKQELEGANEALDKMFEKATEGMSEMERALKIQKRLKRTSQKWLYLLKDYVEY